jgi:hypothetical protein
MQAHIYQAILACTDCSARFAGIISPILRGSRHACPYAFPGVPDCRETCVIASKHGAIAKWLLNVIGATVNILISVTEILVEVRQCRDEMQVIVMYRQHLYKFAN